MRGIISRLRAQRTKLRERLTVRRALFADRSLEDNPLIAILIALTLWAATLVLFNFHHLLQIDTRWWELFPMLGNSVFLLAALCAATVFLTISRPVMVRRNSWILLLALISFGSLIPSAGLLYIYDTSTLISRETGAFLFPFALAPLLTTMLLGRTAGLAVGLWTSLVIATVSGGQSFLIFVSGMVATAVAAFMARTVKTRSKALKIGVIIGFTQIICVLGLTAINWETASVTTVFHQAGACLASGLFAAMATLIVLPFFESMFRITSDITLLELSDLSHPLLHRLALEAPGTYHHSLIVASLALAAADRVGANPLLARVCAYFHDIGKLTKPEFFAENIQLQSDPHASLSPSMSTLVIMSHVKEGISLAMHHKLPRVIINAIREHHGTSLVSYFHHKALVQSAAKDAANGNGSTARIDEGYFRYPGPKPSTRESAIIGLADAIEAASRSMERITPRQIEHLVTTIINSRIEDGQFTKCDITLGELTKIKHSLVFTLTNMHHKRVPYPNNENRDKQPAEASRD